MKCYRGHHHRAVPPFGPRRPTALSTMAASNTCGQHVADALQNDRFGCRTRIRT